MSLDAYLTSRSDRLPCGHHRVHECACEGIAAGQDGMAVALSKTSESERVEAAIRQLARGGKPFSANDARQIHGVRGGVVGATFNALRAEKVIRPVGEETSTDRGTHGKRVALWIGAAS